MEPQPKKPFWKSKFLWGIFLTLLQMFLKQQGIDIPDGDIGEWITALFAAYGARDAMKGGVTVKMILLLFMSSLLLSSCTGPDKVSTTKITSVEVSGSKVKVKGTSHFPVNLSPEKIDSTIKAATKDIFDIDSFKTDTSGTDVEWILTTPELPIVIVPQRE